MSNWLKAMNPSTPITNEAEAARAARASAVSIIIGVIVGLVSLGWTLANPQIMQDAMAQAGGASLNEAQMQGAQQFALYTAGFMVLLQIIFGAIQWRRPGKFIAILFLVLLAYGIVSTAATPLLAGSMPNMPVIPIWQLALSLVIMIVQVVLHVTGLKGIKALDRIQMEQAR